MAILSQKTRKKRYTEAIDFREQYHLSETVLPKFNKNKEREKEKGGERKQRNFGNTITKIPLPKILPVQLKKKQLRQRHCRKRKKKNLFWQLWQCHCRKWKKKIMKSVNE